MTNSYKMVKEKDTEHLKLLRRGQHPPGLKHLRSAQCRPVWRSEPVLIDDSGTTFRLEAEHVFKNCRSETIFSLSVEPELVLTNQLV